MQSDRVECFVLACTQTLPGKEIWIKTKELGVNNLHGTVNGTQIHRLAVGFFFYPRLLKAEYDVSTGIPGRLSQKHSSSLSEDFASCACRVAGPQPRGFSVRQQSDGQHHRPARRDGLPPVSQAISAFYFLKYLTASFQLLSKLRAASILS